MVLRVVSPSNAQPLVREKKLVMIKKKFGKRLSKRAVQEMPIAFLIPNFITIMAVCSGLTSVKFAMDGLFPYSIVCILLAVLFDGLDGPAARFLGATSKFGGQLDSFADLINFGVSPGLVMYYATLKDLGNMGWVVVVFFTTCLMLRLSRFNVSMIDHHEFKQPPTSWRHKFSVGLPAPASAYWCLSPLIFYHGFGHPWFLYPKVVAINCVIASFLMVSRLPTILINHISIKPKTSLPLIAGVLLFLGMVVSEPWGTLSYFAIAYLLAMPWVVYLYLKEKKRHHVQKSHNEIK